MEIIFATYHKLLRRFKTRSARAALAGLFLWVFVAIFADILAHTPSEKRLPPLIPYAAADIDSRYTEPMPPFTDNHIFGTDKIGRDVAAGLIEGAHNALIIAFSATFIASFLGILFGLIVGFYGDNRLKMPLIALILRGGAFVLFFFYVVLLLKLQFSTSQFLLYIFIIFILIYLIIKILDLFFAKIDIPFLQKNRQVPLDALLMRLLDVIQSFPFIFILLAFVAIFQKLNALQIGVLLGCLMWVSKAQLVRGEVINIRKKDYIEAAHTLGLTDWNIMLRHLLPNILTPIYVMASYSVVSAILMESSISFLGLGLMPEQVTWGTMLNEARSYHSAWWLGLFPSLCIFILVLIFNKIGRVLDEK